MSDKGRPWFPIYARDALTDSKLRALSDKAFRILFLLWCECCKDGSIPADHKELRKLLGLSHFCDKALISALYFFDKSAITPDRLISPRMEADAAKYREVCDKRKAAANKRYANAGANAVPTTTTTTTTIKEVDTTASADAPASLEVMPKASLVVDTWNTITAGCSVPQARLTPKRAKVIATRLREPGWMTDFERACTYITTSAFHSGQNDRGWCASLDWLLQAGKATEVAEKATQPTTALTVAGGNNGARKPSATHQRVNDNLAALAAAAISAGDFGANCASGPDGDEIPAPGFNGRDAGLSARLQDAIPSLFALRSS